MTHGFIWESNIPADCPFPHSDTINKVMFTGRHAAYTGVDTWYPTWASDNALYSPWADGSLLWALDRGVSWLVPSDLPPENYTGSADQRYGANAGTGLSTTGQAKITGDDPLNLKIEVLGTTSASPAPYDGRYPAGSLVHDGIWYYGTYCLDESGATDETGQLIYWDRLGPFVGFRTSVDFGKTWQETPHTGAAPIFGESSKNGQKVKFGAPHFVDFGCNMQNSPDGNAYLVGHGATYPDANPNWIAGDQVYLARVKPSLETINNLAAYEFFCGYTSDGSAIWDADFSQIQPLLEWHGNMGCVTVTYNAPLQKYLMCVTDGGNGLGAMNTYLLEAPILTGTWRIFAYWEAFGAQGYFVNFPSKFISDDGRTLWVCYAANYMNYAVGAKIPFQPEGGGYGMSLQEIKLI